MKKLTILIFIPILLTVTQKLVPQNIYKQRMTKIYKRIRQTLLKRERNQYLKNKHVLKITLFKKNAGNVTGIIRLNTGKIKCLVKKQNQRVKIILLSFNNIDKVKIIKWEKIKMKVYSKYTKYLFTPKIIRVITKQGKIYTLQKDYNNLFSRYYMFTGNETIRASSDFILYYDRLKKKFYGSNKSFYYHLTRPPAKTVYLIQIENYSYDNTRRNPRIALPDGTSEENSLSMRQSRSQEYFEQQRKLRLKRERERRAREEQARRNNTQSRRNQRTQNSR